MYSGHKCPSILMLAALHLGTKKEFSAHKATYEGIQCPTCKKMHRTTRFASTIHTLRHDYGWDIETDRGEAVQANYIVHKVGEMPKDAKKVANDLPRWLCLGIKRTSKGPGGKVKGYISHDIDYPNQPDQKHTTDASGRWAWGHCSRCSEVTLWRKHQGNPMMDDG